MAVIKVETRSEALAKTIFGIVLFSIAVAIVIDVGKGLFGAVVPHSDQSVSTATITPKDTSAVEQTPIKLAPIQHGVLSPTRRSDDPIEWRQYGAKGVARIDRMRALAAKKIARLPACDEVMSSDIDTDKSDAAGEPIITAVCTNMTRVSYTHAELVSPDDKVEGVTLAPN